MKQFHQGSLHLQRRRAASAGGVVLFVLMAGSLVAGAVVGRWGERGGHVRLVMLALTVLCALAVRACARGTRVLSSGLAGERAAAQALRALPDSWRAVANVKLKNAEGRRAELDFVLIGPSGVFVVESKHHRGRICGKAQATHWQQCKTGRGGGTYTVQLYSPVKQVGTHVHLLAQALRAHGMPVWVQGVVYFSNPEAQLAVEGLAQCAVPVFCAAQDTLATRLRALPAHTPLRPKQCAALYALLCSDALARGG